MSSVYYSIIIFIFGLFFGSFYNVIGLRLPQKKSIVFPGSHCPKCKHVLKWYELIPVISYIFLGGKCKKCKKDISPIYPFIELATGLLFSSSYLIFGLQIELIFSLIFVSFLMIIIVTDIKYMVIPDTVMIVGLILLIIVRFFIDTPYEVGISILNGIGAFTIMYLIKLTGDLMYKKETMGGGDIKLMTIIGFVLGIPLGVITIFLASLIAFPVAITLLITKKTNILPFGPFLAIASLILFLTQLNLEDILNILY